jgi:hypothetical protein
MVMHIWKFFVTVALAFKVGAPCLISIDILADKKNGGRSQNKPAMGKI